MRALLDSLPAPVWARDSAGAARLRQFGLCARGGGRGSGRSRGAPAGTARPVCPRGAGTARAAGGTYTGRVPAIVAGGRRIFEVVDVPSAAGSAGIAIDRTEVETMRAELTRMVEAHRRMLDQLATGVAIFNVDRKLTFYNAAFRALLELDAGFLDQTPTDAAVLDTLRSKRKLPEEQDFRAVEDSSCYEAYRAVEPKEHMWHLPDGRTLRVVTTPNPEGGVTYLYR